ncbi:hypothetical protein [Ferrimonas kyonanensis]|uniref:hypothetical protein n=1 Tax=Ferrimonas kyonanensis TaxID=364763 RepID=UPI00041AB463|nr:hypothetical protein [Ferrimonas kyonanensis]
MTPSITRPLLAGLMLCSACVFADEYGSTTPPTNQPMPAASDSLCVAQDNWAPFEAVQMPDGNQFSSDTSCDFHRWSWQMFLWLMQDDGKGEPRFLGFDSPYDLLGIDNRESLLPRLSKQGGARSMDEYLQAGTEGILVGKDGKPVYYSQYINREFVDFINEHELTDFEKVQAFDPNTSFDINVAEFKAAWKIVDKATADSGEFLITRQSVFKLVNRNGKIVVDVNQSSEEYLALVGFHIAGVVEGHPEMIWATFEHKDNAPDVPTNVQPDTVVSDKDWTFYTANTPYSQCNINYASSPQLTLDEASQTLSPTTEVCRRFAWGNNANQMTYAVPTNIQVVQQLNDSTLSLLDQSKAQLPADRNWLKNYFEVSAIWFRRNDGLEPNMTLATDFDDNGKQLLIGGLHLSNSTIETFTQTQSTMDNCFRCHNTSQRFPPSGAENLAPLKGMNLNISHAFMNIYFWDQEMKLKAQSAAAKQ